VKDLRDFQEQVTSTLRLTENDQK